MLLVIRTKKEPQSKMLRMLTRLLSCRRKFPPVSGGVIEDVRFLKDDRLIIAYYGGVSILSTEAGAAGMILDYGVSRLASSATFSGVLC